jgi:PAS domain S-box-containing protein
VKNNDGTVLLDGAIRDITKQKEAEQQLNESRTFLDNVMRTVAAPIFVKDSKLNWVMFNDAFCWFMGKKRVELLGKSEINFFNEEDYKKSRKIDNQVLRTGDILLSRDTIRINKNSIKHLLTVKSRFVNDRGEKFLIGFITDITEIRKREEEINKLNANLLGVMESTHESIYAIDRNYNYVAFNKNHARMAKLIYGHAISIGANSVEYVKGAPEYKWLLTEIKRAFKGEHFASEQKVDQQRYTNRYIQTTYNPIFDTKNNVTGVAIFVRDITDMKLAQEAIHQTNATLSGVIASTKDRIFAVDTKFRYIMFNRAHATTMKHLTGRDIQNGDDLIKLLPKGTLPHAKKQLQKAMGGTPATVEFTLLDQFLEASVNPIKDNKGKVIGATMFVRDMTHRKKTEQKLKLLNEELTAQNGRLASQEEELRTALDELSERNFELDQLMYKTSHDLRSPLSSILGLVNLAHMDTEPENQSVYLNKIEDRIKKLDEFIRSMLNYARVNRSEIVLEKIDLKTLIQNCVNELENLENFASVKVKTKIVSENVDFNSDPLLIKIIFSNIISNAYKYYNPHVESHLNITVKVNPLVIKVTLKDNGIGIEKEYVPKIFDMFFRATERSQGSGLGMYIVKQAVEKLKGTIEVKSIFGKGTTISLTLPNN